MVGEVEGLRTKLQVGALGQPRIPDDGEVKVGKSRTTHIGQSAPDITERVIGRIDELRGVEPAAHGSI